MSLSRWKRLFWTLCFTLCITAVVWGLDRVRGYQNQQAEALRWSRQMAVQLEGWKSIALQRSEVTPLEWVIDEMRRVRGPDAAWVEIFSWKKPAEAVGEEFTEYFRAERKFDYAKVLQSDTGAGARIVTRFPFRGFFGTTTLRMEMVFVGLFFTVIFFIIFGYTYAVREKVRVKVNVDNSKQLKANILVWLQEMNVLLSELGSNLGEVLRVARDLIHSSAPAQAEHLSTHIQATTTKMSQQIEQLSKLKKDVS